MSVSYSATVQPVTVSLSGTTGVNLGSAQNPNVQPGVIIGQGVAVCLNTGNIQGQLTWSWNITYDAFAGFNNATPGGPMALTPATLASGGFNFYYN